MKLCIPAQEANGLQSATEAHFPHASHLIVFDTETRAVTTIPVHEETEQESTPIDAVLCASINRMTLRNLLDQGIQVYGTGAEVVEEAIAQFERGELEAVGVAQGCGGHGHGHEHGRGGCCGGHEHEEEHECCGGKGHDDPNHECCGGHGHDDDHECCGGKGHDDPDHECCGGKGHGHAHKHGQGGCGCRG